MASTAEKASAARVLRDAGHPTDLIAELLHASLRTAQRWLQDVPEVNGPDSSAADDLEALIASQELDEQGRFQAGVARRLAQRLDKIAVSDKAQDALAMPQIAKELRAVVADIMGTSQDDREWLAGLLAPVRNPEDPEP